MTEPAISVRSLSKKFGSNVALDQLSLHTDPGEIYGMLGSNGSGKSTLLRILVGGLRPTSGSFTLRGSTGYVSQRFGLYEDLSVDENLVFHARCHGLSGERLTSAVERSLNLLNLQDARRRKTAELSHGWKHRVAIAAAICHRPAILIMDEPTAGIDPLVRGATWEILAELARAGTSIVIATHHLDEAERCDRIGFLRAGRLLVSCPPNELKLRYAARDDKGDRTLLAALAAVVREGEPG